MRDHHSPPPNESLGDPPADGGSGRNAADNLDDVDDPAQIDQLARLDDMLGGLRHRGTDRTNGAESSADHGAAGQDSDTSAVTASDTPPAKVPLDALLLLRQVAATDPGILYSASDDEHIEAPLPSVEPYEIVGVLGRGGFSVVYEAVDPRISRRLALKVIRPELMLMPGMRRRFLREAEIAARLRHPNIIILLDVGSAEGRVFLAEEYCEGGSLADWLKAHPGPVQAREAAAFVATLAEAVSAAHAQGVLHRDLKPANILLVPATDRPPQHDAASTSLAAWQPKVADFGLAALRTDDSGGQLTHLTATGNRLGTPAWMAPEQIDASFGTISQATDIHALGRILERLLTGTPSHRGESDVESFRRILLAPPVPVNQIVPGISADLTAVCLQCLEKEPTNRYSSAAALAADLNRFLAGEPTQARPQRRVERIARRLASSRWTAIAAAVVIIAAIATGLFTSIQHDEQLALARQAAKVRRSDASAELLRGFGAWETGNVPMALASLARGREFEAGFTDTLAAKWLLTRLHNEDEILFRMPGDSPIYASAISPDGSLAAAGAENGTIALIPLLPTAAANDRQPSQPRTIDTDDEINTLVFHPDGQILMAASQSGGVSLWDVTTGQQTHRSDWGTPLYGLACSPDGHLLAFGGEDRLLRFASVADPSTLVQSSELTGVVLGDNTDSEIECISFINSQTLAVTLGNKILKIDAETGAILDSISAGNEKLVHEALAWSSACGLLCASGGSDGRPFLFTVDRLDPAGSLPAHPNWVRSCEFSPDGSQIATACRDGIIRVFDTQSMRETSRLIGHVGQVWKVAFAGPELLVSTGGDGSVRRWNTRSNPPRAPPRLTFHRVDESTADARIVAVTLCEFPDRGSRVAAIDVTGLLRFFDSEASRWESLQLPLPGRHPNPFSMTASRRSDRFVVPGWQGPSLLVKLDASGTAEFTPIAALDSARAQICWTDDDRIVISGAASQQLFLLDSADDQPVLVAASVHQLGFQAIAASPVPPTRIVAADHDRITLFTLDDSGKRLAADKELPMLSADVVIARWSPDGTRIACGTKSGGVALYDLTQNGTETPPITSSHAREVRGLAFDESGQTLISVDAESMRVHDTIARVTYDTFTPGCEITGVTVAAGDRSIILGTSEGLCTIPLASREQMQDDLGRVSPGK